MRCNSALIAALCFGIAGPAAAQFATIINADSTIVRFNVNEPFAAPVITGAPYSAREVRDRTQTLGDGTHIVDKTQVTLVYRDSAGRTRTERSVAAPLAQPNIAAVRTIEIRDPAAGYSYVLDTAKQIAHRSAIKERPLPTAARLAAKAPAAPRVPAVANEQLGTQIMEGVSATGMKNTRTWPLDSIGNDKPIVATTETWMSPQLKTMVLLKMTDPRMGDTTMALKDISLGEPDPALFQPPAGYQIVDETGEFEISFAH